MKFGAILKKTRQKEGLSQMDMAVLLDLPRSSVSKLENDKAELRAETLLKWSKIIASHRCGQAYEAAAVTLCNVDVSTVMQTIMQLFGG